jgi:hypothetical protein
VRLKSNVTTVTGNILILSSALENENKVLFKEHERKSFC